MAVQAVRLHVFISNFLHSHSLFVDNHFTIAAVHATLNSTYTVYIIHNVHISSYRCTLSEISVP